ncbi:Glucosidase II subunit alpha [Caenorhabditis elegans]|uniref:Glucosidase II subunit alpha n=1 Tax=Caenorhabditis elegans TaxID=6239 RepID=Q9U3F8_CAEEL|nr:Gal_mutarotas_2 domain-containing protein [Caenorhabditis elegans]CAB54240.1 Gal_mutarotas_2 domain-containing protein [Caenorhabditis elegans]|eukprot:NP_505508.1 Acid Alpha Glucosidase Relate [Caenorhabditis elegans]
MTAGSSWIVPIILLATPLAVQMVKRDDFKTCEQSAFCKQHRAITEPTGYELLADSITHHGAVWTANVRNSQNTLKINVIGLADSTVRVQIDEPESAIRKRYVPNPALVSLPEELEFSSVENGDQEAKIIGGNKKLKVVVTYKPFLVSIFNEFDELVAQLNRDGKLKVEEFRTKEEGKEYPEGFWEERFKGFTDHKQHGSSSVGVDISFVNFKTAYGLPEHADAFALRNTVGNSDPYRLYNLDVFEYELNNPMALYVSIPYILAHRANRSVGALWFNAAETWVDTQSSVTSKGLFGKMLDKVTGSSDNVPHFDAHFISESGLVDVFFFVGPTVKDVQRQNSKLTGVTPLPPLFSIGYHQCRWNYNDEQDVATVNQGFDDHDMPMDVIWLDIEHTDGKKYFTWDKHKFPTPNDMVDKVAAKGRKMVTIVDPHIKKDDGYYVYKDAKDKGLFVKRVDGSDFEGHCWPGSSEYLDFWHPDTRSYWKDQFAFDRYTGSSSNLHIWNDMNEPSVFSGPEITMDKESIHYGGIEHREIHNMYGMMYTSATFDGMIARTGGKERPFLLSRAGFIGTQRTAAIWTGDNTADWGHLEIAAPMTLSLSIAGVPFVGADVGGFFGNPDEQLLSRWYQTAAFQPFFRAHAHIDTRRREPWLFSEQTQQIIREALRTRYALLPYWYTLFQQHTENGVPPMRPLFYEFENDDLLLEEQKQWMVGSGILARPVVEKDTFNVQVKLPRGEHKTERWFEWVSGNEVRGESIYVDAPITFTPIYQRGGTIIPTWQRIRRSATLMKDDPITLFVALDSNENSNGEIYLDDGNTHDYQSGQFVKASFKYTTLSKNSAMLEGEHLDGKYAAKNWIERVVVRGVESSPKKVEITRVSDPVQSLEFSYDHDSKVLVIRKPEALLTSSFKVHIEF